MNNILEYRSAKGITLEQMGDFCGCTKSTMHAIQNGKSTPDIYRAYDIAKILGKDIKQVFPNPTKYKQVTKKSIVRALGESS